MKRFVRLKQIYAEKLPLMKIQIKKIEIFLSQLLIITDIQNLPL